MKITQVICAPGKTGFFFDDQKAIKNGAKNDGAFYEGTPVTPGFTAVRQAGESISVIFVLENGAMAYGDCAAVQYSGAGGRDPLFLAKDFIPVIEREIAPLYVGKEITTFREMADRTDKYVDPKTGQKYHTAIRYGVTQACLDAVAKSRGVLMAEVIADEYGTKISDTIIPIFSQSGDDRYLNADKMIMKAADVLPHALFNHVETKVGLKGQAGDSVYAEGVDVGTIATQSPAANSSAKAGDTVTYQLSKGTEQVEVPSVVGDGENGATSTLEAAGFGVTTEYEASDSVDKGYVISQSPSSGTADKGSTVTIKVSTGPTTIDASQYVGASEGSATSALQNKGVTVTVEYKSSGSHAAGTVISVSPSSTKKGGSVTLTVSSGSASGGTDANGGGSSNNGSGGTGNNGGTPSS